VAKRPELLILDEPVASLDPLARRDFLRHLMESVAENDTSVILSSHLVSDLERVCDYLVVLVASRVQLAGETDDLLAQHHRIVCARRPDTDLPPRLEVIWAEHTERQSTFIVRSEAELPAGDWSAERVDLEDLVLT
jgi:ABC-2 type transport system ATP-binding protein